MKRHAANRVIRRLVVKGKCAFVRFLGALRILNRQRVASLLDYIVVEGSGLFDDAWYVQTYSDVARAGLDPLWHYCNVGWREGRPPSPMFDGAAYLNGHPDAKERGMNPLVHYILHEARGGRTCPLVSVVVASYNYADLIKETLDGILAQTYGNFEIIVVDDGSKDDSVGVIEGYAAKYGNVHLYTHEGGVNKGLPATVKLGVEMAKGEYVAFCEADDIWTPDHLERKIDLVNFTVGQRPDVIINDVAPFGDKKRCRAARHAAAERMKALCNIRNEISVLDFRRQNWICTFSSCMVAREVLAGCDFTSCPRPPNLDWWLWRQVCCGRPVFVVREKLTKWRMHDSYMAQESVESILRQREFIDKMDRLLLARHPQEAKDLLPIVSAHDRYSVVDGALCDGGVPCERQPAFSVVMATYNRASCICTAIDSILCQTYRNFELVVVDDGSTDHTADMLRGHYAKELECGRIKYVHIENGGVSKARNVGLRHVSNEWIAYLDSDNEVCESFLETFARAIVQYPSQKNFYAKLVCRNAKRQIGREFDLEELVKANYIDLGVYVHHRDLIDETGPFDEKMTRLVDWELIVRQAKVSAPHFLDEIVLVYNDEGDYERITTSVSLKKNMDYFRRKHCHWPTVTTIITTYNHEKYIKRALESAVMQDGEFVHEILVSDDASTDQTHEVIKKVMEMYPGYITDISGDKNGGIAANMRKCFQAAKGDYVAVLEGDDYWISEWKLNRQVHFMRSHADCSMCFSRIKLLNPDGKFSLLPRQEGLPAELTGEDFIRDPNQNLIANFSCTMFRGDVVRSFPDVLFSSRFNEIACAFYVEKVGPIGFLPDVMSVYRIHDHGVWSASDRAKQVESSIKAREVALAVCAPEYRTRMQGIIDKLRAELKS